MEQFTTLTLMPNNSSTCSQCWRVLTSLSAISPLLCFFSLAGSILSSNALADVPLWSLRCSSMYLICSSQSSLLSCSSYSRYSSSSWQCPLLLLASCILCVEGAEIAKDGRNVVVTDAVNSQLIVVSGSYCSHSLKSSWTLLTSWPLSFVSKNANLSLSYKRLRRTGIRQHPEKYR